MDTYDSHLISYGLCKIQNETLLLPKYARSLVAAGNDTQSTHTAFSHKLEETVKVFGATHMSMSRGSRMWGDVIGVNPSYKIDKEKATSTLDELRDCLIAFSNTIDAKNGRPVLDHCDEALFIIDDIAKQVNSI